MSKEKRCKCCQQYWWESDLKNGLCPNCYDYVADLEAKLAESNAKSYTLESYNNFLNNQCKKLIKENKQLKQQLATREQIIKENKDLYDAKCFSMSAMEENHTQDKIEFAIAELEKTEENLYDNLYHLYSRPCTIWETYGDFYDEAVKDKISETINEQIKRLKASTLEDKEGR